VSDGPGATDWSAVLLDIEGTTTPITFVHDILFPYARERLGVFLRTAGAEPAAAEALARLRREHAADEAGGATPPAWPVAGLAEEAVPYLEWLMDRDRKSPGLKALQGLIWEQGYVQGELRGVVFDDVPRALRAWHAAGKIIAIYSSGSVLAQRRLFETTLEGDLTPIIAGFFDTGVGAKTAPTSYARIADALGVPSARLLFISDVTAELAAARAAGYQVRLSIRPGNPPQPAAGEYVAVRLLH
jgi:enolase-phosphatase E1